MDFDLSEEHEAFRKVVRDFAEHEIAPHAERWDRDARVPARRRARRWASSGSFGLPFPEEYGGSDADFTTLCVAIEELARVDSSIAITLEAGGRARRRTDRRVRHRGAAPASGCPTSAPGRALAAFGLTEPDAGSDAGATRTRARRDGDEWVIDGAKAFITNSGTPITVARHGDRAHRRRVARSPRSSCRHGRPGSSSSPPYRKMGWHASDTHPLRFDGCRVPVANTLGDEGDGLRQFLAILDDGRIAIAALAVGLAQACLEQSVEYAGERDGVRRARSARTRAWRSAAPTSP